MPVKWKRVTKEKYWEMLEVLPPAVMGGGGFMVGEPFDHNAEGKPRFDAFIEKDGKFFAASEPMTIAEFRVYCPNATDFAYSDERTF